MSGKSYWLVSALVAITFFRSIPQCERDMLKMKIFSVCLDNLKFLSIFAFLLFSEVTFFIQSELQSSIMKEPARKQGIFWNGKRNPAKNIYVVLTTPSGQLAVKPANVPDSDHGHVMETMDSPASYKSSTCKIAPRPQLLIFKLPSWL